MDIAFIFVSLCYSLGATFKMLKAVLKKSREGGKGTKKDTGMTVIAMFYTPAELSSAEPGLSMPWCSSAHPRGAGAAGLPLPAGQLQCIYCCISSGQDGWEQLVVVVALEILRAGCVCCAASSYVAWGQPSATEMHFKLLIRYSIKKLNTG